MQAEPTVTAAVLAEAFATFEKIHASMYGYTMTGEIVELIAFKVTAIGRRPKPTIVPSIS